MAGVSSFPPGFGVMFSPSLAHSETIFPTLLLVGADVQLVLNSEAGMQGR